MTDDNELIRYLASYIWENYPLKYDQEQLDRGVLEELIKEFYDTIP